MLRNLNGLDQDTDYFYKSQFWESDSPNSLVDCCLSFIVNHFTKVFFFDDEKLNLDIHLPPFLFEELHRKSLQMCRPLPAIPLVECLSRPLRFPIRKLDLSHYEELEGEHLRISLCHNLVYLHVDSENLNQSSLRDICGLAPSLVTLKVGRNCRNLNAEACQHNFHLHKLKHLSLNYPSLPIFLQSNLHAFSNQLTVLDLSDCQTMPDILNDSFRFKCLESLSLHNVFVSDIHNLLHSLTSLKTLRKLDLGVSNRTNLTSYEGDLVSSMRNLVHHLTHLESLELCGTNLVSNYIDTRLPSERFSTTKSDVEAHVIPWLVNRRLEYLGLLNSIGNPCSLDDLPADRVSGDFNIDQILTSLQSYINRPPLLLLSLNLLFDWVRSDEPEHLLTEMQQAKALEYTMKALDQHRNVKDIQLSGSASIFYLMKGSLKTRLTVRIKRHIIRITLDAMEKTINPEESSMCRNGCLILCHFRIPQDLIHDYARVVMLLLQLIKKPEPRQGEPFIQRVSLNLLNSLACQVDNQEKLMVGHLGTFKVMLDLIKKKLEANICDEIMEVAWSLMWNATDETAANCERFIMNEGLAMFMKCYEAFKERGELLRNMMGLMGNVAEVDHLKCYLITQEFIPTFRDLLDSESDGIEVSYNSCGILANLMLTGPTSWGNLDCYWSSVQVKMRQAMVRWPITSERNINYRSFGPILRLLECRKVIEVQQWALWALCNLTKVYRSKYCALLKEEGGVNKLIDVFIRTRSSRIRKMSAKVIRRCNRFESHPDEVSDSEEGNEEADDEVLDCNEDEYDDPDNAFLEYMYTKYFHDLDEKRGILNSILEAARK